MKALLLFFAAVLLSFPLRAQLPPFEQQQVMMADGRELLLWISLNEASEILHYKQQEGGKVENYQASEVVSFSYGGHQYYTLPLRDRYYTFFKVYHEGKEFAVLEKAPSFKALRVIADDSRGRLAMCQNRRNHEFYLCQTDFRQNSSLLNPYNIPIPTGGEKIVRELEVRKLVYLAVEGQLKLFYMETNERMFLWDDWMGPRPGNRRVENMFEEFIKDEQKISLIQKKVKEEKLDIRDPQHLIMALKAVYQ